MTVPNINIPNIKKGYPKYVADAEKADKVRVYINKEQYFEGVRPEVWEFHIGGYQVCEKRDEQVVRVAESVTVVKKAVSDFEADVREIRDRLYTAFMEKSGDHTASDNMARRVCEEFGLPDLG